MPTKQPSEKRLASWRQYNNQRSAKRKESHLCYGCKTHLDKTSGYCSDCLARYRKVYKPRSRESIRQKVFEAYGGYTCKCCGETNKQFLTIDHINGKGNQHRKITGAGQSFYYWLIRNHFPFGFQVLCYNCNCGRAKNKGVCPHAINFTQTSR